MLTRCILASLALLAPLAAQTNQFDYYDNNPTSRGTSRGALGNFPGRMLMRYSRNLHRAIGNAAGNGLIDGVAAFVLVHDAATTESFSLVALPAITGNQPDCSNPFLSATLSTPPGPPQAQAYTLTATFSSPLNIPLDDTWFGGIELGAASTNDGLLGLISSYCTQGTSAPALMLNTDGSTPCTLIQVWQTTLDFDLFTPSPVLNVGADIPSGSCSGQRFGPAGTYPNVTTRGDGLIFRVRDANAGGGSVSMLASFGFPANSIPLPVFQGNLALDPLLIIPFATVPMPGSGEVTIAPPGLSPGSISSTGPITFQALIAAPTYLTLSNAWKSTIL